MIYGTIKSDYWHTKIVCIKTNSTKSFRSPIPILKHSTTANHYMVQQWFLNNPWHFFVHFAANLERDCSGTRWYHGNIWQNYYLVLLIHLWPQCVCMQLNRKWDVIDVCIVNKIFCLLFQYRIYGIQFNQILNIFVAYRSIRRLPSHQLHQFGQILFNFIIPRSL